MYDELIEELQAKQKELTGNNKPEDLVIPQHYNKADDILTLTDEAIKCEDSLNTVNQDTLLLQKYNR